MSKRFETFSPSGRADIPADAPEELAAISTFDLARPPMTDLNLTELKRLAMAATPGPWLSEKRNGLIGVYCDDETGSMVADAGPLKYVARAQSACAANGAFIAAANPSTILSLIKRVEEAEDERDEATNWTELVERHGTDKFDDLADKWVAMEAIQRVRNAVASVFVKWASEPIMARFRDHMDNSMRLAFVEGALCGVKSAEAEAHARGVAEGLERAAKMAEGPIADVDQNTGEARYRGDLNGHHWEAPRPIAGYRGSEYGQGRADAAAAIRKGV